MENEYRIRVRPMVPWPGRHGDKKPIATEGVHYAGKLPRAADVWLIIGAPVKPSRDWDCGTDVVWPILDVEGAAESFEILSDNFYVCRHQIQIGD